MSYITNNQLSMYIYCVIDYTPFQTLPKKAVLELWKSKCHWSRRLMIGGIMIEPSGRVTRTAPSAQGFPLRL